MSKTVLVTGTSSGFGKDTVETLAEAGHQVFAAMRDIAGRNAGNAAAFRGRGIDVLELDVTSDASVDAAFAALFDRTGGRLDVLVNNAGSLVQGISEAVSPEVTRAMFDVNVVGVQRMLRAALPQLRRNRSGLIINVGSILGRVTIPFMGLYGASKFAVEAMTESYRYELSQLGIDVVLLQPSAYPTNLYAQDNGSDGSREAEYGPVADAQRALGTFLAGMLSGANAPNPHDVATAIAGLIATPAGQRPPRLVVGAPFGADAVNAAVQPIQGGLVQDLGMAAFATLRTA